MIKLGAGSLGHETARRGGDALAIVVVLVARDLERRLARMTLVLTFATPNCRQCAGAAAGTPAVEAGRIASSSNIPDSR